MLGKLGTPPDILALIGAAAVAYTVALTITLQWKISIYVGAVARIVAVFVLLLGPVALLLTPTYFARGIGTSCHRRSHPETGHRGGNRRRRGQWRHLRGAFFAPTLIDRFDEVNIGGIYEASSVVEGRTDAIERRNNDTNFPETPLFVTSLPVS